MKNFGFRFFFFFVMANLWLSIAAFAQKITVIGIGKLGLCQALCLDDAGFEVLGVDVSAEYVESLNTRTYRSFEPFVNEYLENAKRFKATTSLEEGLAFSDICFIALSTTTGTDAYDFSMLCNLLSQINERQISNKHLIISSTHSPGFIKHTAIPLLSDCKNVTISYNPQLIAQGDIINGIKKPDLVLIGEADQQTGDLLEAIYGKVCINSPHMARMSVESAEITKLGLNCFLTAKIALANLIGDIANETPGADKFAILGAIGRDSRIGSKYMQPGYGFGGPCFPRDNRGLGDYAVSIGIEPIIFQSTDKANDLHSQYQAKKFLEADLNEYVFEDVSYKDNCPVPLIEASQKLEVARLVAESGKKVTIVDNENVIVLVKNKYKDLFNYSEKSDLIGAKLCPK